MSYRQLTPEERYLNSHLRKQGFTKAQIAAQTGRHRSTIGRDLPATRTAGAATAPVKPRRRPTGDASAPVATATSTPTIGV